MINNLGNMFYILVLVPYRAKDSIKTSKLIMKRKMLSHILKG